MTKSGNIELLKQSQSRYGLETRPTSLFYLFVRVYADSCRVKTMNFWYEVMVQKRCLSEALSRTIEILIGKISKKLCTAKPTQHSHKIVAYFKRFEVRRVSRPYLHSL